LYHINQQGYLIFREKTMKIIVLLVVLIQIQNGVTKIIIGDIV